MQNRLTFRESVVRVIFTIAIFLLVTTVSAQNKVVVIPMAGDDVMLLANTVTVATENGDFDDPVAALASITDASAINPYLLFIAPGVYELGSNQLIMKEYVEIAGSGQSATVLRGSVSGNAILASAIVVGASNASIRDLTIENIDGLDLLSIGLYNDGASPMVADVTFVLSGASTQIGIYNLSSSSPTIRDSIVYVADGSDIQHGVGSVNSNVTLSGVAINVSGGGDFQYGINGNDTISIIEDSTIFVSGGENDQYGVFNWDISSSTVSNSTITVSGGNSGQYGVYNDNNGAVAIVKGSNISAPTHSVYDAVGSGAYETYISDSILTGSVHGDPQCSFTFLSSGSALDSDCSLP